MQRTRRGLLGAGVGVAAGLAGCLGVEGVEYPAAADDDSPGADDGADTDGADDGAGEDEDGDASDADQVDDETESVENEALAAATRRVVEDTVWFATEYPAAVETYRDAIRDLVGEIDAVRESVEADGAATVEMAERLDDAGRDAGDRAADALEPHFHPRARIVSRTERSVDPLRRFADRDDVDRFLEELARMRRDFAAVGTDTYVREAFSREPIHNRLLDRLLYPLPDDRDRRRAVRNGAFVEIAAPSRGFSAFAHVPYDDDRYDRSRIPRIYGSAFEPDRRAELRARLGPIPNSDDRTEELFVAFATRPKAGNRPSRTFEGWAHELGGTPVYVQRYPDAETAAARLESVLDAGSTEGRAPIDPEATDFGSDFSGNATDDGDGDDAGGDDGESDGDDGEAGGDDEDTESEGPTRWHRFYHHEAEGERYGFDDHAGVQYGYLVRAGEFLLATGFSGDAWEERTGWQDELATGWAIV